MHLLHSPLLLIALTCAACTTSSAGITDANAPSTVAQSPVHSSNLALTGEWGGERAALTLTPTGGRIEYDCGQGTLDAPIVPDAHGAFRVGGQHMQARGGPAPKEGEMPSTQPVQYHGSVSGDRMQLEVSSGNDSIGSYVLQRGASAQLHHCL
jgi:hypothetical protein